MWQLILAGILCVFTYRYLRRKPGRFNKPPTVPGLPLLGNVNEVQAPELHHGLSKLAEKHGAIFTVNLMGTEMVIVNCPELIHEASVTRGDDFAGRSTAPYIIKAFTYGGKDVMFIPYGKEWKVLRKAVHAGFKALGEERVKTEDEMRQDLENLVEKYRETEGRPANPHHNLKMAMTNIVSCVVAGRRVKRDTDEAYTIVQLEEDALACCTPGFGAELDFLPFLRWLPISSVKLLERVIRNRDKIVDETFDQMKATYEPDRVRCLVDTLIEAQKKYLTPDGEPAIDDDNIKGTVLDIYFAGVLSSFSTVSSMILLSLHYPHVQEKLQQEIDAVIGQNQAPSLYHRPDMHYLNATIMELQRYISVATLSFRSATKDTKLAGYDIPKDMPVMMNIWEVHHSKYWGDPWVFRPERFLDDDRKLLPNSHPNRQRWMPFGLGSRVCVGEALARNAIFLFIAYLWKNFSFLPVEGEPLPSCDPRQYVASVQIYPKDYKVRILERD